MAADSCSPTGRALPFTPEANALRDTDAELAELARISAVIEAVLINDFEASREGKHWYRFWIGNMPLQAGINGIFRVQAKLCATDTNLDMRKLATSLAAANKTLVGARFEESDCYLYARAARDLAEVSAAQIKAMVQACSDALESPQGQALGSKYRTYD